MLPPLRERSDFAALTARVLAEIAPGREIAISPALSTAFAGYGWPGNLRQLANALRTACALLDAGETIIDWQHLPDDLTEELRNPSTLPVAKYTETDTGENLQALSEAAMVRAITTSGGNMSEAARRLGISRNTLYRRFKAAGRQAIGPQASAPFRQRRHTS